jgi:hypothetical protein
MGFMTLHPLLARPIAERVPSPVSPAPAQPVARPYTPPLTVAHSPTIALANPAILQMRNPAFGVWSLGRPLPRSSFSLPVLISPDAAPKDSTLFEDPADPSKKYYLTRYAIATQGSGGAQTYSISFAAAADGFDLTVNLADSTDPAVAAGDTRIDATTTRYFLQANLQGLAATWDFGSATTPDGSALTLTLTVNDPATRDSIYRAMTDPAAAAQLIVRRSFEAAIPAASDAVTAQPLYRQNLIAVDSSIAFTFDPVLDKNVFALLGSVGSGESNWAVTPVPYAPDNRSYPYYQDMRQPTVIYYLPDSFKISRQQAAPHAPSVTITTNGSDPSSMRFMLSFLAIPVWNPERIADAAGWWQQNLHATTPPAMHLFEASNTSLQLTIPSADGSGAPALAQQSGAIIDIAGGISCTVTLSLAQLQQVYGALFDQVSQLLSGVVTVTVNSDVESVHFTWRATDFVGNALDTQSTFDSGQSAFNVVVSNVIESPVHVDSLPAAVMKADPTTGRFTAKVPDLGQTATPTPPVDLVAQPASGTPSGPTSIALSIRVLPENLGDVVNLLGQLTGAAAGSSGSQSSASNYAVVVDQGHTTVEPDASAIWDAIMSNQVVAPVQRSIKVMAFASMFAPPATVKAAQVVFQGGQTVNFDASTQADSSGLMSQTVTLEVPVKAYVLGSGDTSYYQYRVDLIGASGTQQGQWVSSNTDSFYVQTSGS